MIDVSDKDQLRERVAKEIEQMTMPIEPLLENGFLVPYRKGWYEVTKDLKSLPEFVRKQIREVQQRDGKTLVKILSQKKAQKMLQKITKAKTQK